MKRAATALLLVVLLATGAWWMLSRPFDEQPRLVLLYAPCTVNRDFLSPYDPDVRYTPSLQKFADQAVVFTKHVTEAGQSGVAFAALFTGTQAMRHGVYYHPTNLSDSLYTIAEAYRDAGYETFFWAGHPMASPELHYGQGVSAANTFWRGGKYLPAEKRSFLRAGDARFGAILQRLREDPEYKAFVMTNFTVTHGRYVDLHLGEFCAAYPGECPEWPEEELERISTLFRKNYLGLVYAFDQTVANLELTRDDVRKVAELAETLYKSNVHHLDQLFGAVADEIQASGLLDESVIVLTADHGEVLYRAGAALAWTHGFSLAPEVLQVPLLVRAPSVPPGRYESVTRSIDVFPTLAGLTGIRLPVDRVMGVDLSPALRGNASPPALLAFSHTSMLPDSLQTGFSPILSSRFPDRNPDTMWVGVRGGDLLYELTSDDGRQFDAHVFDLVRDPTERNDLYDPQNDEQREMIRQLARYRTELAEAYRTKHGGEGQVPSDREKELLRSLGYIE